MKNKIINFSKELFSEIKKDDIISAANELTYKIFFSLFPFIIFLMSVVGFLRLDSESLIDEISAVMPNTINGFIMSVIKEIVSIRDASVLSFSLFVSVYSASSGFKTAMRGINKAYEQEDDRKLWVKILISVSLVIIFAVIIIASFILLIFGDEILNYIKKYIDFKELNFLFNILRYIVSVIIMFFSVILINKLAVRKKTTFRKLFPGSVFTVLTWMAVSQIFNIYIDNFSNYSVVYGSIAGIIILILWLNIMCSVLLIGSEINATAEDFVL